MHQWDYLIPLGPDFVRICDAMWKHWEDPSNSDNSTLEDLWTYTQPLLYSQGPDKTLHEYLTQRKQILFDAMKDIAESYLLRPPTVKKEAILPVLSLTGSVKNIRLSTVHSTTEKATYKPTKFITSGSASNVWDAETSLQMGNKDIVLKQIFETQKDSAINEFGIAQKLLKDSGENEQYIVQYLDIIEETPTQVWLALEKIPHTKYGIDLTGYILHGFFKEPDPSYRHHARAIARDLLLGLQHIANRRVILRDLKADNVLIFYNPAEQKYSAKWSDFGLSLDLDSVRHPIVGTEDKILKQDLIGFWYDTQKLVPRPAWKRRRPPEECYKVWEENLACYDIYMLGVIFCSMASGVDWAHMEKIYFGNGRIYFWSRICWND